MNDKPNFIGRVNISYKVPRDKIKDLIAFYHELLGLPMFDAKEEDGEHVLCKFGTAFVWFIPTNGEFERTIWLEIEPDDKHEAMRYFLERDIRISNFNEDDPEDMEGYFIQDPIGMVYRIR